MRKTACVATAVLILLAASAGLAQQALKPRLEGQALVDALRQGGYVILLRHTSTEHVAPDPGFFDISDCSTQRDLSAAGRRQAEEMGKAFKKLGVPVGEVLSSPYCRCLATGKLAFGKVQESQLLSVFDGLSVPEKSERGGVIRKMLDTPPQAGTNTVLITHTGTLLYSFGLQTRPEGIAHVFKADGVGVTDYMGMILADQWPELAAGSGAP